MLATKLTLTYQVHAIEGMSKALAWELGHANIRVNTVCPTFIETSMTAGMFEDPSFRAWVTSRIALGRVGQIEEVMRAIVFLASSASSLVTGSALMMEVVGRRHENNANCTRCSQARTCLPISGQSNVHTRRIFLQSNT